MSPTPRREFLKQMAMASAYAAAGALIPGVTFGEEVDRYLGDVPTSGQVTWRKTPCRFCGVGCGLLVGVEGARAVAVGGTRTLP
jgi:nitrate reductase (cytochrome)